MGWIYLHDGTPKYDNALDQVLKESSHRAAGLVAGAFVEDHLTIAIKTRLVKDVKIANWVFKTDGPVGSFGAKIDLGYLMSIYSTVARRELITIKDIRNAFAHRLEVRSFDEQPVKDWCANLTLWETCPIQLKKAPDKPLGVELGWRIGGKIIVREGEILLIDQESEGADKPLTNRDRFINACKFYLAGMSMLAQLARDPGAPIF